MRDGARSLNLRWVATKQLLEDRRYHEALEYLPKLFEDQLEAGLTAIAVDTWLKVVFSYLMLNEIGKARAFVERHVEEVQKVSSRHARVGLAFISAWEEDDPEPLRKAAEHFSQAWKDYRYSEYPSMFQTFEAALLARAKAADKNADAKVVQPYDYSTTSFTLWMDGLDCLAARQYLDGLAHIRQSFERYAYAELLGDAAWSWYDTIVCYLFLNDRVAAGDFYSAHVTFARSISSHFAFAADNMLAAYDTKSPFHIESAMQLIAEGWPGYPQSQYPAIFANFDEQVIAAGKLHCDYGVSAYSLWTSGMELITMSFPQRAMEELERAKSLYIQAGLWKSVGWVSLAVAVAKLSFGDVKGTRDYIAKNMMLFQRAGDEVLQVTRAFLQSLEEQDARLLGQALLTWFRLAELPSGSGLLALQERLTAQLAELSEDGGHDMRSSRQLAQRMWIAQHKGLRVELSIDRIEDGTYEVNLVDATSVIQPRPIRKLISEAELEGILSALSTLALRVDGVRRGLRVEASRSKRSVDSEAKQAPMLHEFESLGRIMYHLLLPKDIRASFQNLPPGTNLVLRVHDELLQYPWELMFDGKEHVCLEHNISRVISSENFYVRQVTRPPKERLRMLIIGDPLEENPQMALPDARAEAISLADELSKMEGIDVTLLLGSQVTTKRLLSELSTGYDLIHYSGHVAHDDGDTSLLLANRALSATTLRSFIEDAPPLLVFVNACESGRERAWRVGPIDYENRVFGMASAFLSSGCYYIGSIWPVYDKPAIRFAKRVYQEFFLQAETLGAALRTAREQVWKEFGAGDVSWASYVFYGDPILMLSR